jgi:hypothetical protein
MNWCEAAYGRWKVRLWRYVKAGREFNVIYARDGTSAFPPPIFTKLAHDQQHYVHRFSPKSDNNADSTSVSEVLLSLR